MRAPLFARKNPGSRFLTAAVDGPPLRVRSCWEIYGGIDADHLPSSGTLYDMRVTQGAGQSYEFVEQWDEDEGAATTCFASTIAEAHTASVQHVFWGIETQ